MKFFNRHGSEIPLDVWRGLFGNPQYRVLATHTHNDLTVTTSWVGVCTIVEIGPPKLFLVEVAPAKVMERGGGSALRPNGKPVYPTYWAATEQEAMEHHREAVKVIRGKRG